MYKSAGMALSTWVVPIWFQVLICEEICSNGELPLVFLIPTAFPLFVYFLPPCFSPLKNTFKTFKHMCVQNILLQKEITLFYKQNTVSITILSSPQSIIIELTKIAGLLIENKYVFNVSKTVFHPQICHKPVIWRKRLKDKNTFRFHSGVRLSSGYLMDHIVQHVHTTFQREDKHCGYKRWLKLLDLFRILQTKTDNVGLCIDITRVSHLVKKQQIKLI